MIRKKEDRVPLDRLFAEHRNPNDCQALSFHCQPSLDTSNPKRPGAPVLSSFVFLDTTGLLSYYHRDAAEEFGRASWTERMVCRRGLLGSAYRRVRARRLVSANLENASRIRNFGSVRIFGHDACEATDPVLRKKSIRR